MFNSSANLSRIPPDVHARIVRRAVALCFNDARDSDHSDLEGSEMSETGPQEFSMFEHSDFEDAESFRPILVSDEDDAQMSPERVSPLDLPSAEDNSQISTNEIPPLELLDAEDDGLPQSLHNNHLDELTLSEDFSEEVSSVGPSTIEDILKELSEEITLSEHLTAAEESYLHSYLRLHMAELRMSVGLSPWTKHPCIVDPELLRRYLVSHLNGLARVSGETASAEHSHQENDELPSPFFPSEQQSSPQNSQEQDRPLSLSEAELQQLTKEITPLFFSDKSSPSPPPSSSKSRLRVSIDVHRSQSNGSKTFYLNFHRSERPRPPPSQSRSKIHSLFHSKRGKSPVRRSLSSYIDALVGPKDEEKGSRPDEPGTITPLSLRDRDLSALPAPFNVLASLAPSLPKLQSGDHPVTITPSPSASPSLAKATPGLQTIPCFDQLRASKAQDRTPIPITKTVSHRKPKSRKIKRTKSIERMEVIGEESGEDDEFFDAVEGIGE